MITKKETMAFPTVTLITVSETTPKMPPLQPDETPFALHPQQSYVLKIAQQQGIETKIVHHSYATNTCHEKARLLQQSHPHEQWKPERVVKALYGVVSWEYYGFVLPEMDRKLDLETLATTFTHAKLEPPVNKSDFYFTKDEIPKSMESGTCTPFPTIDDMQRITALFIYDFPDLNEQKVDISLGGQGEQAHKVSMHLPYEAMYRILRQQFGEKIMKVPFPSSESKKPFYKEAI